MVGNGELAQSNRHQPAMALVPRRGAAASPVSALTRRLVGVLPTPPVSWRLPRHAGALNALLLGEREATLLGYRPQALRRSLVVLVALATGAAVAMCGVIGFVGLVVPHLLRLVSGPDHRLLLPGSALAGGSLLIVADAVARTVVAPAELPIGVLTALLGGPFFLWLLLRQRMGETP